MPPTLVECPPSDGGYLLLAGTMAVGSGGVDLSCWVGENDIVLILFESTIFLILLIIWSFSHQSLACWLQMQLV